MTFHERTTNAARGKWKGILLELGIPSNLLTGKHAPCPLCGGKDRFMFDDKEGRGSSICHQCGARSGIQLAMDYTGLSFPDAARRIDAMVGNLKPDTPCARRELTEDERVAALREVYLGSRPIEAGDLAYRYLCSRGLDEIAYPKTLRFHPGLRDGEGGIRPALLAMVGLPGAEKFATIHRTFLRADGSGKAEMAAPRKLMPGPVPEGACVALSEYPGSGPLGIAEGIETALAASARFEIPVWSAINTTILAKWTPPEGCEEVVIFADHDPGYAGQAAAFTLAHRLASRLTVTVRLPDQVGEDWADVHFRSQGAAA